VSLKVIHHRSCEAAAAEAGRKLAATVGQHKKPLLLLSGGSSLNAVRVMVSRLSKTQKKRLKIMQIDARYVPFGHEESNWTQIENLFGDELNLDRQYAMYEEGKKPRDLASDYSVLLESELEKADITIGVYGMGADGHIAGIKPTKIPYKFMKFLDGRLVVNYKAKDYQRITTTQELIVKLNKVIGFVCGKDKYEAVKKLNEDINMRLHPAQLLKDAKDGELHVNVGR